LIYAATGGLALAGVVIVQAYGLSAHRHVGKRGSYGYNARRRWLGPSSNTGTI
jgi:hypothetical protein